MPIFPKPSRPDELHCAADIPDFPAQALFAYDAALRGRPVVVACQDPLSHKSAAWSCSREAHVLGIRPGMPNAAFARRFARVVVVARNKDLERAACSELERVCCRYSPHYDVSDKGRCLVDLSRTPASRAMSPAAIAVALRRDILAALPIAYIAVGISRSPLLSRLAAKRARPNGTCVCEPGDEFKSMAELDSGLLPGLSALTRERLGAYNLSTIGHIRGLGRETLVHHFGAEGEKLYGLTMGMYSFPTATAKAPTCAETILDRDINDWGRLHDKVRYTADKLCFLLKSENLCIDRFVFALIYGDNKTVQRTVALPDWTNEYLPIAGCACKAFTELYQRRVAVKTLRLIARSPQADPGQTDLFETAWERKQRSLALQITRVRKKLSFESVKSGVHVE
jgi:nucleotidyltransferase/DNA polymerase involved in DNA repair